MRYGIDRDRGAYVQTYVYVVQSEIYILFIFVAEIIVVVAFVGVTEIVVRVVVVADEILVLSVVYLGTEVYGELQDIGYRFLVQVDVSAARERCAELALEGVAEFGRECLLDISEVDILLAIPRTLLGLCLFIVALGGRSIRGDLGRNIAFGGGVAVAGYKGRYGYDCSREKE